MTGDHRVLLLAHGSSDDRWCKTFENLAAPTLDALPNASIAYMELSAPSLQDEVERAATEGVQHITVLPLFLAAGRHLRKDVPAMLEELRTAHGIQIQLAPPIGENPELGHAIQSIARKQIEEAK